MGIIVIKIPKIKKILKKKPKISFIKVTHQSIQKFQISKFIQLFNTKNYIDKHLKHIIDVYIFLYC